MFEFCVALFYGAVGGLLYGLLNDRTALGRMLRLAIGALAGLVWIALALLSGLLNGADGYTFMELMLLTLGSLVVGLSFTFGVCRVSKSRH